MAEFEDQELNEQVEEGGGEQPDVTKLQADLSATTGRLQKTNAALETARAQLAGSGWTLDDDGNVIAQSGYNPATQQTYQQQIPQEDVPEIPDMYTDPAGFHKWMQGQIDAGAKKQAEAMLNQFAGVVMPIMDNLTATTANQRYTDWQDVGQAVTTRLKTVYRMPSLSLAIEQNPQLVDDLVYAERARRGAAGQPGQPTPQQLAEAERQARIAAATGYGGGSAGAPASSDFTPDESAYINQVGMSQKLAAELLNGPAIVGQTGQKKGRK